METQLDYLCGLKHDGDEIPVEYDGLSAELKSGDKILVADGLIRLSVMKTAEKKAPLSIVL